MNKFNQMKNFVFALVAMMSALTVQSQEILKVIDVMGQRTIWADNGQLFLSEDGNSGFRMSTSFKYNTEEPIINGVNIKLAGLGSCVEAVELIIQFEDGTLLNRTCWNDFNCDGNAWFYFTKSQIDDLLSKNIERVRVTNGRTHRSLTLPIETPDYFVQIGKLAFAGTFTVIEQ